MNGESTDGNPPPSGDNTSDEFVTHDAEVFVGQGGMVGRGLAGAASSRRALLESQFYDVTCAECGVIARDVPAIALEGFRRQHEAEAHPDIYVRRKKLALAILARNRRLWRR